MSIGPFFYRLVHTPDQFELAHATAYCTDIVTDLISSPISPLNSPAVPDNPNRSANYQIPEFRQPSAASFSTGSREPTQLSNNINISDNEAVYYNPHPHFPPKREVNCEKRHVSSIIQLVCSWIVFIRANKPVTASWSITVRGENGDIVLEACTERNDVINGNVVENSSCSADSNMSPLNGEALTDNASHSASQYDSDDEPHSHKHVLGNDAMLQSSVVPDRNIFPFKTSMIAKRLLNGIFVEQKHS